MVNILTSVRDKRGGLVPNLEKNDFTILEDGKPQAIKYFTKETDLPLTIGLLVDVSGSQRNLIDIERNAASQFFSQVLRKKDEAFLISFGEEAELLQDYTGSPRLLTEGLGELRVSSGVGGIGPGPVPTAGQPRGTVLYDAVYLAANEKLKSEVGRKVIVVITDGVDQGSRLTHQPGDRSRAEGRRGDLQHRLLRSGRLRRRFGYGSAAAAGKAKRCSKMSRRDRRPRVTKWTASTRWTRSSKSCRTRCAASTPSATPRPTTPRTAATASWISSWPTRT